MSHSRSLVAFRLIVVIGLMAGVFAAQPEPIAQAAPDATFSVNTNTDTVDANPGNGSCADSIGNCSLRAAVMEANALGGSNTVNLAAGTYTLSITGLGENAAATGDLDVTGGTLTLVGAGVGTCGNAGVTCINANNIDRVFHVQNTGALNLTGITVTGGNPSNTYGGGIEVDGASAILTLTNCLVTNNRTGTSGGLNYFGGGIDIYQGSATINNSTISNNLAWEKGGGIMNNRGTLTVTNSTISGNEANLGGGIYNQYFVSAPTLTISNSAVISNTTSGGNEFGGGIVNGGTLNATNVTLAGNTTNGFGGALTDDLGAVATNLSFVTVANNTTNGSGSGAVDIYYAVFKPGKSIFAENTGGNFAFANLGALSSQGYNLSDGVIPSAVGTDIQNSATVNLLPLANNGGPALTRALGDGSAAINVIGTGVNGCVANTSIDQRGAVRAGGTNRGETGCDIGAYEYHSDQKPNAVTLRDMSATTNGSLSIIGTLAVALASLAALGALLIGRRVKAKAQP